MSHNQSGSMEERPEEESRLAKEKLELYRSRIERLQQDLDNVENENWHFKADFAEQEKTVRVARLCNRNYRKEIKSLQQQLQLVTNAEGEYARKLLKIYNFTKEQEAELDVVYNELERLDNEIQAHKSAKFTESLGNLHLEDPALTIEQLRVQLAETNQQLAQKNQKLAHKDQQLLNQSEQLVRKTQQLTNQKQRLTYKDQQLDQSNERITLLEHKVKDIKYEELSRDMKRVK
ncbi:hypothetical protein BDV96DRAFT_561943 [Lophiotrema nucula]|uniref:Uncharacterized protein n=1 Tax=Lophiotrema nucula TaxID=690887 RepID=A0A6A5ZVT9_9PLEO|nr:hypothetical protein BDV96DRAFT_561943 [Lophiotrema nucula]